MADRHIELRGVAVHNLCEVDLDVPHHQLVVFCGVSGSGKTSLALDTLYAEGQRRYIESFSAYTRQFLERLEKPTATRIDGIPPSIAVTAQAPSRSSRATVGTATETNDYLRLLFAKIGHIVCTGCGNEVSSHTAESAAAALATLPDGLRYMVTFQAELGEQTRQDALEDLREDGFVRVLCGQRIGQLSDDATLAEFANEQSPIEVVVDRLKSGDAQTGRIRDSLETAFTHGGGACRILIDTDANSADGVLASGKERTLDGKAWWQVGFYTKLYCEPCGLEYTEPEPRFFSFNSPLGACPRCEGFGNLIDIDMDLVVPDASKSIKEGAIAPWNTPAYAHELKELIALASDYNLPIDVPFRDLQQEHIDLIRNGVPERKFGGLAGFFEWLEKRKYKMHLRVFLSRWRSYNECPDCNGARLRPEALAVRIGGKNVADICRMKVCDALEFVEKLELSETDQRVGRVMFQQVYSRLKYLVAVGLGYLTLDRTLRTLSGGEAQRVALTSALGSSLVNMLYVLDEPSVGLHPQDTGQLLDTIFHLRDRGNSVVVVEHEEAFVRAADQVIEIGPAAGESGGRVTFQGTPIELEAGDSLTGQYLSGRRGIVVEQQRRAPSRGWIKLADASGNNLQNVTVEFPLGVLCIVSGVSGAGKSTLVQDTLYPALCQRKRKDANKPLPFGDVYGDGQIDDVVLVDQSPIGRSPRSNPVTYIKAFDAIRAVFADTLEARTHNYTAGHFSFNVDGGRCSACQGDGFVQIDMQFLADVYMKCSQCHGHRYRKEILDVKYRNKSISDVLNMSIREAFIFFRGQEKVQKKLKQLIDVGLEYLRLGQPANTLSSGEAQRLKLASYLSTAKRSRTLFLLDEPTTGLHFSDVVQLLDCFEALLGTGHSMIIVEHNMQLMRAADYIIDLGPGAADKGGRVVAQGTPEEVSQIEESATGRYLASALRNGNGNGHA